MKEMEEQKINRRTGDGSPLNKTCTHTCCPRTANRNSTCREISKAAGPVPLYLIPQALSKEIHDLRDAILEIRIQRTSGHNYGITVIATAKEEDFHEP